MFDRNKIQIFCYHIVLERTLQMKWNRNIYYFFLLFYIDVPNYKLIILTANNDGLLFDLNLSNASIHQGNGAYVFGSAFRVRQNNISISLK